MDVLDYKKIQKMYAERSKLDGDHSVLSGCSDKESMKSDILLDYITKKMLIRYLQPQKSDNILDFGCGVGRLSFLLQSKCNRVLGVDASQELIDISKKRNKYRNIEFLNIDFEFKPIEYSVLFDKIFTLGVMYHIPDENLVLRLKDFNKLLKKNGRFVFIEHVNASDKTLSSIGIQRSMNKWKSLLSESGFKIILAKPVIRVPSYSLSIWKRSKGSCSWLLPVFHFIEKATIKRKPKFAEYFYYIIVCEKENI